MPDQDLLNLIDSWRGYEPTPDNDYADGRFDAFREAADDLEAIIKRRRNA